MLKLSSNCVVPLGSVDQEKSIRRISESNDVMPGNPIEEFLIVRGSSVKIAPNYAGYLFFEPPATSAPHNSFQLEPALSYLRAGDVVRIDPKRNALKTLYRKESPNNALLLTERCNNFCLMCSQPPKKIDDSFIIEEVLKAIPLMSPKTNEITLTGGEPTLLGQKLVDIIRALERFLPSTGVHILSNGRLFKDWPAARSIAEAGHHDLMIGIPVYSDISSIHDFVVQADGAFDDTIRGIINLKSVGVKVEIRVVLHRLTYERLPDLALFIRRNLTFCDHVALMGLEMTGFTKFNLEKLWIDPKDYQAPLREAVETLARARMNVSIYNHQLCILDPALQQFNRKSISDWKNEYMEQCNGCARKAECGGFFSSSFLRHSSFIKPFRN